ncbi:hypothetical protein Clacol_006852 [Clathrus columnatus]|uniref:Uncharacterized protein n=1 Tax=Clathrus columnatus TaxID=1419009 RepID=A0AAV5AIU9_9AGAM|nr:hypothetical protein Clacol_006852 [Clathrus columnatus]
MDETIYPAANLHSFLFSNPFHHKSLDTDRYGSSPPLPKIPDSRVFCVDPHAKVSLTFGRLRSESLRLAQGIHERFGKPEYHSNFGSGSSAGPVVLVQLPNSAAYPLILLGFIAAGWVVSTSNPANTSFELAHFIELCEPKVIITQPGDLGEKTVQEACRVANSDAEILLADVNQDWEQTLLLSEKSNSERSWTSLLSDKEFNVPSMTVAEANSRVAMILWTSGTTGKSKGAMLTHRAIVSGVVMLRIGNPAYLSHEGLSIGATIVIQRRFDLKDYLSIVARYGITFLHVVPPVVVAISSTDLVEKPEYSLSSVLGIASAGAPLPPELVKRVRDLTGAVTKSVYGMTESGPITSFKGNTWDEIQGNSGLPIYPVEISIVPLGGLNAHNSNTSGEIVLRSPAVMLGYLKNQKATEETLRSGGLHTGDHGYLDEKGYLRITGRLKELIKYKGFQVSPTELEAVISEIPEIKDVTVSSIYSEAQATELPMAYVIPRTSDLIRIVASQARPQSEARAHSRMSFAPNDLETLAEQIKQMVENRCIYYKRLRGGVMFVCELPKSPNGKVVRSALKDLNGVFIDCYADRKVKL